MSSTCYDNESDITNVTYHHSPPTTSIVTQQPCSQQTLFPPIATSVPSDTMQHTYVTVQPNLDVNISWVRSVSETIRENSILQIGNRQGTYRVVGFLRRSARNRTLLCESEDGQVIGLIVKPGHYNFSWKEILLCNLLFTFCSCILV